MDIPGPGSNKILGILTYVLEELLFEPTVFSGCLLSCDFVYTFEYSKFGYTSEPYKAILSSSCDYNIQNRAPVILVIFSSCTTPYYVHSLSLLHFFGIITSAWIGFLMVFLLKCIFLGSGVQRSGEWPQLL